MSLMHGNPTFGRDPACSQEETSEYEEISEQELNTLKYTEVQCLYYGSLDNRLHTSCIWDSGTECFGSVPPLCNLPLLTMATYWLHVTVALSSQTWHWDVSDYLNCDLTAFVFPVL